MAKVERAEDAVMLRLSEEELVTLLSCINETLEALDPEELSIRVGRSRAEVKALQADLREGTT
ncbi:MAG: hypothetical protein ABR505_01350 [Actinomycetota bacterium]